MTFPIIVALLGTLPAIVALLLARRVATGPESRSVGACTIHVPALRDVHCTVGCATTTVALFLDAQGATRTDAASAVQQVTLQAGHAIYEQFRADMRGRAGGGSVDPRGNRSAS